VSEPFDLAGRFERILEIGADNPAVQYRGKWYSWEWLAAVGRSLDEFLPAHDGCLSLGLVTRNRPGVLATYVSAWSKKRPVLTFNALASDEALASDLLAMRPAVVVAVPEDWGRPGFREAVTATGALGLEIGLDEPMVQLAVETRDQISDEQHHCDDGVAVVLQTSGTTGPPKRIPLKLANLAGAVASAQKLVKAADSEPRLRSGTTILALPLGHMSAVFGVCLNVAEGRRIVLMDRFEPNEWARLVAEHNVTVLNLVPTAMRMVLDAKVPRELLQGATIARSGAAPLSPELAEEFEDTYGLPVLQNYGSTEFAGGVAGWNLEQWRKWGREKRGSVGTAVPGVELRVVDPECGDVLSAGERGVLEVKSPFTVGVPRGTWVRTNDLAELDADGFLWLRGRVDDVIVRGGFKIDANEVRTTLENHPLVKEAIVVSLPDRRLGEVPGAVVEAYPEGDRPDAEALTSFLRQRLEAYKVPVVIRIVDSLPRNGAMKVQLPAVREILTVS
jgi:long-chain acyl-CoA synthetase